MTIPVTLSNVGSLIDATTAKTTINNNSAAIVTAFQAALDTGGDQMEGNLDMNSFHILNLPSPGSLNEPIRVVDVNTLNGGGTITVNPLPAGGTTGQVLEKNSNTSYDTGWYTPALTPPAGNNGDIQYNNSGVFGNYTPANLASVINPFLATSTTILNALSYGVVGDGITNDAVALNAFFVTAINIGAVAYLPGGKTYAVGNSSLVVPDYLRVVCGSNAVIQRNADPSVLSAYNTYTGAMISMGNNSSWVGGNLNNSQVLATSNTSHGVASGGTVTFTTQAGLPLINGTTFLRIWSAATPSAHYEGTVNTYSGTTLVLNATFAGGSGTHTDWQITVGAIYQCPMVMHQVQGASAYGVTVTGNWYVGLLMDGWNPTTGGTAVCKNCAFINCKLLGVQNRGMYFYGNCRYCKMEDCFVDGLTGLTDYGINSNPANVTGSFNTCQYCKISNTSVTGTGFQGMGMGDATLFLQIDNCSVDNMTASAGVGFLIDTANAGIVQFNQVSNCIAQNCPSAGFQAAGQNYGTFSNCKTLGCGTGFSITSQTTGAGTTISQFCTLNSCQALNSTTIGFSIAGSSNHIDVNDLQALNSGGAGVAVFSGCTGILLTGRSFNNSGGNLSDAGTSTIKTSLNLV